MTIGSQLNLMIVVAAIALVKKLQRQDANKAKLFQSVVVNAKY